MNDDYLWDRSGPPDPEIARLEQLLRPLGRQDDVRLKPDATETARNAGTASDTGTVRNLGRGRLQPARLWKPRSLVILAAAAVLAIAIGGWWILARSVSRGWDVTLLDGSPSVLARRVTGETRLPVGGWLETGEQEKAFIQVADIGNVTVDPHTRLRLVRTRKGEHRLELARGTMRATIVAPPGQFFVDTPSATVVDLGCVYTLTVDPDGAGLVSVALGWVAFEWRGRESLIPAGFTGATRPGIGPGTPYHMNTAPAVRAALDAIDFPGKDDLPAAIDLVLANSGERDEVTLWHLLSRVPVADRDKVFDRLLQFVPPPDGVTRDGIRRGDRLMLERWWDAMGLGDIALFRTWRVKTGDR